MNAAQPPLENADQRPPDESALRQVAPHGPLLTPGEVVAERFRVERLAGTGGMGAVYRAHDLYSGVAVALKIVASARGVRAERFAREAHLLSQVVHPAIVRYIAHGSATEGVSYLAMEWLDGEDLCRRLTRTGLKIEELLVLMRRICSGLSLAHERGVTHRDLKPSNLFLVQGRVDAVKLIDFGIAHQAGSALTGAGSTLGTIGYMAPEQAMGAHDVDARADVFALGCVMFESLTGRPAFEGVQDAAVLAKVLRDEVPRVRELRPEVPGSLDQLVARMLSKQPAQRPADARALLQALDGMGQLEGPALPLRSDSRSRETSEQRIASVIVARPHGPAPITLSTHQAAIEDEQWEATLRRFGARPVPLRGGQTLLVFGADAGMIASDSARQAVRCALALKSLRPHVWLGVGTGSLATALNVSVGIAIDHAVELLDRFGEPDSGVLVDPLTADLLGGKFELVDLDRAQRVVRELAAIDTPRLLLGRPTACVGREKELALLQATLSECVDDNVARSVLVSGEPGIGKSRLASEFLRSARERPGVRAWVAQADPAAQRSPLYLVQRLVQQALGLDPGAPLGDREARLAAGLAASVEPEQEAWSREFVGELAGVPSRAAPSPLLAAARNDPAVMREQTRRALRSWLNAESARGPIVLVLEDLQWADAPSLSYLEDALLGLRARPLCVLGLTRPDAQSALSQLFTPSEAQIVRLHGLTRRAAERLVRDLIADAPADVVQRVLDLADGNALYLEELIRRVAVGGTELPETVRAIVRSRFDSLPADARQQLRAASVFGENSWVGGVRALLGGGPDVETWFFLMAREEIFVRCPHARYAGETEYAFRHALLRDAAYAMLSDDERRAMHTAAARWMERAGEADPCAIGDHLARGGQPGEARPWLLRGARAALDSGDMEAAIALSQRGLDLGAEGRERGELLLVLAHASAWGTQTNLELAREALALLPTDSSAWWFALSLLVFGAGAVGQSPLATPYLELAEATPPPLHQPLGGHGQAFEVMAVGAVLLGRAELGWSIVDKFRQLVASAPDYVSSAWLAVAECQLATNTLRAGSWELERAVHEGRSAVASMRHVGNGSGEATALLHLSIALHEIGLYQEAEPTLRESRRIAARVGNVLITEFASLILTALSLRRLGLDACLAELAQLERSSDANMVHACQAARAQLMLRSGDIVQAAALAESARHGPGLLHRLNASLTLARAQLAQAQPQAALATLEALHAARGSQLFPQLALDELAARAEILSALGDAVGADAATRAARRFAEAAASAISDPALRAAFSRRVRLTNA